ncbi:MAG: 3-oxoacyl-[acyl-carrier-protein] synthase, KASII [Ignavibacteriae bacterium]|nr:MAG: 3-oxoacyl-[acyl-carrier-protein] synthase, KASII [Ignavibacteriota bacterium]
MGMNNNKRRVVITGLGAVTPIGNNVDDFWKNLIAGKSGVGKITGFDTKDYDTKIAAEIKGFDPTLYIDKKSVKRMDPFTHYALASAEMAYQDSNLNLEKEDKDRIGVIFGSGIGGMWTYYYQTRELFFNGPQRVSPLFVPMMISDIAAGYISMRYGIKGPNYATTSACATSSHAIASSFLHIQRGDADVMFCGGSEAAICPIGIAGFNSMKAMSTRNDEPEKASRPFDSLRDGFVMGEGGAVLVLEELEHALNRGAKIYAELNGIGLTADAYHITAPAPGGEGAVRSMSIAIKDANLQPTDVDYINAHGTSTPLNDKTETEAIKTVFGEHAYKLLISSNKSMIGHLLGAAGAVEAVATIKTITDSIVPPTINLENPDPECDLNYVPNVAIKKEIKAAISNTFGFGGHNASLLFTKFNEKF